MKPLIVAAGMGTRLRRGPKHLVQLWGRPVSYYPAFILSMLAESTVTMVVQSIYIEETRAALHENGLEVELVASFCPHCENGYSLLLGLSRLRDEALLSVADHVYQPCLVEKLIEGCPGDADICVAGDREPRLVDIDEATKIRVERDRVVFSKQLDDYNYIDTGVFIVRDWRGLLERYGHRTDLTMNQLWSSYSSGGGIVRVVDVTGCLWADIDTEQDLMGFEAGVRRSLIEELLVTQYGRNG